MGVLFALLALGFSQGPGWRVLRWYAACALLAALYDACNVVVTLHVAPAVLVWASRISLFLGGLHGSAWFVYFARQHRRPLRRHEKWIVAGGVAFAVLSLVPAVLVSDAISERRIAWMGTTYRDALPTALGEVCYAYYCGALLILVVRYARLWRRGEVSAAAHSVGLGALFVAGACDSLSAARVWNLPYVIDLGFVALVLAVGVSVAGRLVADARALEEFSTKLTLAQAELVKQERLAALGELSAVIAHEVRNPVGIIFNALTTLRRALGKPEPQAETLLAIVEEEAERLKRMVAELLAFARPMDVRVSDARLAPIVSSAVEAACADVADAAAVDLDAPPDIPPVRCDEQLVRQAVINLVTNALQAPSRRGPVSVRITTAPEARRACVEVVDDGAGVPEDIADRIFKPFFTTRPTGTGLGLSVVQRIAEAHGGEVSHRQTPGGGATFVLALPLDDL